VPVGQLLEYFGFCAEPKKSNTAIAKDKINSAPVEAAKASYF
jgi:hypothetical protein